MQHCSEITMATQSMHPRYAPVTYHQVIVTPQGGGEGAKNLKRSSKQNTSKLAMAGKAAIPKI